MAYLPGTTPLYPDIVGGNYPNQNGDPIWPGTQFKGPLLAGNVNSSDGTNNLAGLGEDFGTANTGFGVMAQTAVIKQATNNGSVGQFVCPIVIPAQSQILRITLMVTTVWSGTTTLGIGTSAGTSAATALTTAAGVSTVALGPVAVSPGANATQIANWDNVSNATFQPGGPQDIQIVVLSGSTGTGVGTLTVEYIQGINNAS
jgi:hypothetical protein